MAIDCAIDQNDGGRRMTLVLTLWTDSSRQTGCTPQACVSNSAEEREGIALPHCGCQLLWTHQGTVEPFGTCYFRVAS